MTRLEINDLMMDAIISTLPKEVRENMKKIYEVQRVEIMANEDTNTLTQNG